MYINEPYTADEVRRYIIQAADFIVQDGTGNTTDGNWYIAYQGIPKEVCPEGSLNLNYDSLFRLLELRTEVSEVKYKEGGLAITFDPAYCVHCPETTPRERIDDELQKKLEAAAEFIIMEGSSRTFTGEYYADKEVISESGLPPALVDQYEEAILDILLTYDSVVNIELNFDGEFVVEYDPDCCPEYDPTYDDPDAELPPDREILDPLSRVVHNEILSMLAECSPASIPEKVIQHPPVYMESIVHARENNQLDTFIQSRELNQACSAYMDKAIHDSSYEPNRYHMEAAAKDVIGKYGMERTKIILANTVQEKDYDGRFSRENKEWAKTVNLPNVHEHTRHDFFTDIHPVLLDGFINRVRQMERAAQKTTEQKPSLLGQLKENRQTAPTDKPAGKTKHQEMEV